MSSGLTLEGDSDEEVALWLLTSLCTSAKREVEGLRENRSVIECTPLSEGKMVMNE